MNYTETIFTTRQRTNQLFPEVDSNHYPHRLSSYKGGTLPLSYRGIFSVNTEFFLQFHKGFFQFFHLHYPVYIKHITCSLSSQFCLIPHSLRRGIMPKFQFLSYRQIFNYQPYIKLFALPKGRKSDTFNPFLGNKSAPAFLA